MWTPMHKVSSSFGNYRKYLMKKANIACKTPSDWGLRSVPLTEAIDERRLQINDLDVCHTSIQGYRMSMEDKHIAESLDLEGHSILGILDGHAGHTASSIVAEEFVKFLNKDPDWQEYKKLPSTSSTASGARDNQTGIDIISKALVNSFLAMDQQLNDYGVGSGTTMVIAVTTPTHVFCASVGDSRCVVGQYDGQCISMTDDHKPDNRGEELRIHAAGGFVSDNRVNGELAMSRALGDFQYKAREDLPVHSQMVVAVPDIGVHVRSPQDRFVLLACDGLWDVVSNEESTLFVHTLLSASHAIDAEVWDNVTEQGRSKRKRSLGAEEVVEGSPLVNCSVFEAAKVLVDVALTAGSTDNISILLATLPFGQNS